MERRQKEVRQAFEEKFPDKIRSEVIRIQTDGNLQRFSFSDEILFDGSRAELKVKGIKILMDIGDILQDWNRMYQRIQINGHTDNRPIHTERFSSNWELSSARAIAVLRLFVDRLNIDPQKLLATGYGEFHPVAGNETDLGRSKNRRIEIILVYSEKEYK